MCNCRNKINEAWILPFISTAVQCPELTIDNGIVKQDVRYLGYTARYSCMDGYRLIGNVSRTCLPNGNWSNDDSICEGTYTEHMDYRYTKSVLGVSISYWHLLVLLGFGILYIYVATMHETKACQVLFGQV